MFLLHKRKLAMYYITVVSIISENILKDEDDIPEQVIIISFGLESILSIDYPSWNNFIN